MPDPCRSIAVVDDEAPVRKALGRLLRGAGFGVAIFASGEEFLASLKLHRPDCAVVDLHLPGLSGLELQQRLTGNEISIPCIVITGKDEPGFSERALASGAVAYLRKPVDEQPLLAAIRSAMPDHPVADTPGRGIPAQIARGLGPQPVKDGGPI